MERSVARPVVVLTAILGLLVVAVGGILFIGFIRFLAGDFPG